MSRSKAADSAFYVLITGQVESAEFSGVDNLYCRYAFSYGVDWVPAHGVDNCLSQIARRNTGGADPSVVWNIPVDIAFRATNAYGWPRILIPISRACFGSTKSSLGPRSPFLSAKLAFQSE